MTSSRSLILSTIALASILTLGIEKIIHLPATVKQYKRNVKDLRYYKEATLLTDCLYREGTPVSTKTIKETLETIDTLLPKYFPNGPYTREDFIAMAWLESDFNQYEIGTHGEKGIFQIMPNEFDEGHVKLNKYDIRINAELCMNVLQSKYRKFPDYKRGIIAYNGVVKNKHGRWSEKYWKSFEKRREVIDTLFNS